MENLFKINKLRYDSGNLKTLINQNWQNIGNIDALDKYINIVVFNFTGERSLNYTFHIDNLKFEGGYYFLINSTPNFGYSGAYIRIINNTLQLKSTQFLSKKFTNIQLTFLFYYFRKVVNCPINVFLRGT
ncbi:hypothetical protein CBG52_06050 [Fusobacterium polymorphum]|uniref:Uncharacterized protein n=1 Tax=Fusobacterium nucleatum subsp. polymorphum TaxID=76857 RepID=A0A2C6BMP2_FUSNP|nr:hypothetical protein CBG52_06050 [Fusobacterium polymorphum]